jgi:hypothetical protein
MKKAIVLAAMLLMALFIPAQAVQRLVLIEMETNTS